MWSGPTLINAGTLRLSGGSNRLSYYSPFTLANAAGATLNLNNYSQLLFSLDGGGNAGGNVTLGSGALTIGSGGGTYSGVISGTGGLALQGSSSTTFTLAGANIYGGTTLITAGTLSLSGGDNRLPTATALTFTSGGALNLNGNNQTIASLASTGNCGIIDLGSGTLTVGDATSTGYYGTIAGNGNLVKQGAGSLTLGDTLPNAYSYAGSTTINAGTLGVNGILPATTVVTLANVAGAALTVTAAGGATIASLNGGGANGGNVLVTGTLTVSGGSYAGVISGGYLVKQSAGTLVLAGHNTYMGRTTVAGGTLNVAGSLAYNDSADVLVSAAGTDFGATILRNVGVSSGYAGFGSKATGGLTIGSTADLIGGTNTGTPKSLSMQWRERTAAEIAAGLASDVFNLSGMVNSGSQTDQFTLRMSYSASQLPGGSVAELVSYSGTNWENAVLEDIGGTPLFMGVASPDNILGHYGIDPGTGNTVWAVLDHNSQFAVGAVSVPEPGTLVLLAAGLLGLLCYAWRKSR